MRRTPFLLARCIVVAVVVTASGSAALAAGPGPSAIPAGFRAQALSWVSPNQGWMLGSDMCATIPCTTVEGTVDGGTTWTTLATLNAPLMLETGTGVTEVRFADALHGWIYGPAFWSTSDGGASWRKQVPPGGGHQVMALAADASIVYAVVSPCKVSRLCGQPLQLWRTTPGQASWTQVALALPASNCCVVLAAHGMAGYLVIPAALILHGSSVDPDVLDVTVDGEHWSSRPDPCDPENAETLTSVAPISDTAVALLCQDNLGVGQAVKRVLRSDDNAQTTSSAGTTPLEGIVSQVAAAPNGTLALSSWSVPGSWIYRNRGGRTWTTSVSLSDFGVGWNDLVFTTNRVGFAVYGPAGVFPYNRPGQLWMTQDGGITWSPV